MNKPLLLVVGGGAAGFFAAVNAARLNRNLRVLICEKTGKLLSKVRISGGGRCNLTHDSPDLNEMLLGYPRGKNFLKKGFHEFSSKDTMAWFEGRGVMLHTEADQRVFPRSNSSQTVVDCLLAEAERYGVEVLCHAEVKEISQEQGNFRVLVSGSMEFSPHWVCLATGGYPKSAMFSWMQKLGVSIEEPVPSLFTFKLPENPITRLMGISLPDVRVRIPGTKLEQRGAILITHWGLSGPVVLKLSAWGARVMAGSPEIPTPYSFPVQVSWLPEYHEGSLSQFFRDMRVTRGSKKVVGHNDLGLPQRLWEFLAAGAGLNAETRWADLSTKQMHAFVRVLLFQEFRVSGKTTFKEEFVTAGGVKLVEIDPLTMESRKVPGLFFAGEVMDVDGITGGYNFQHAWTSGFLAARAIAEKARQNSP